jgi:uncharacterized protein (DUF2237 family)
MSHRVEAVPSYCVVTRFATHRDALDSSLSEQDHKGMGYEAGGGGGGRRSQRNVLGGALSICSLEPMTGFFRDGCCNTSAEDVGSHTVCAIMTAEFLVFSKAQGNDLSTQRPEFGFAGLKPGDRWCLCAPRWQEAFEAGRAPKVVLAATQEGALEYAKLDDLKKFAVDMN